MRISVVIPTYNRSRTLDRALVSVLNQTRRPDEVILVDDGSTDGSAELIRSRYPSCRLIVQENRGVSSARNRGIAASTGDWIALLDSDDAWLPRKLELQSAALASNPDYRLCHTEELWYRRGVRVNPMQKHAKAGGNIFRQCLGRCMISPSAVLIHRDLLQELGGFDESLPACEDYDLWLRICSREPVLFIETPLTVKHGGHEDQLSRRYWGMDRFRIQALEKILTWPDLNTADRQEVLRTLAEKSAIIAGGAEKRGQTRLAREFRRKQASAHRGLASCPVEN